MSKSDVFENDFLKLVFNAVPMALLADNASVTPLTSLYVSLHTADPTETGTQVTNEIAYTSYARVPVARDATGWTVTANVVSPVSPISFPTGTPGVGGTATYFAVGTAAVGAGKVLYSGPIVPSVTCGDGVTPKLSTASAISED